MRTPHDSRDRPVTCLALRSVRWRVFRRPLGRNRRVSLTVEVGPFAVAGAVGSPVDDGSGGRVGSLDDLVVR
jgi:hypothetical protein